MKTAILTLAFYHNFGSVLQAYALRHTIQKLTGDVVDILPFRPADIQEHQYFQSEQLLHAYEEKIKRFCEFRKKYLGMGAEQLSDLSSVCSQYDAYIAGSDIIWGKEFSALHPAYFLDFVPEGKIRASYAASMVKPNHGSVEEEIFQKHIPNFDYISVREQSDAAYIQQFTEKKVESVLDPSLLLQQRDYEPLVKESAAIPDQRYILSYFLTHDPAVVEYTNLIAKKMGLKIVHYFADYPNRVFLPDAKCFAFAGPEEFLAYIKNATCVFTNSFHGTCFSIIYRKPFYTYTAKRLILSRVKNLIETLGLEEQTFENFTDLRKVKLETDYHNAELILESAQKKSIDFLTRVFG